MWNSWCPKCTQKDRATKRFKYVVAFGILETMVRWKNIKRTVTFEEENGFLFQFCMESTVSHKRNMIGISCIKSFFSQRAWYFTGNSPAMDLWLNHFVHIFGNNVRFSISEQRLDLMENNEHYWRKSWRGLSFTLLQGCLSLPDWGEERHNSRKLRVFGSRITLSIMHWYLV